MNCALRKSWALVTSLFGWLAVWLVRWLFGWLTYFLLPKQIFLSPKGNIVICFKKILNVNISRSLAEAVNPLRLT
jgi:hypothetical protein